MIGNVKRIIAWLFDQDPGKIYEVKEYKPKRSLNANAYFHVLVEKTAEIIGRSATWTKNDLLADYGYIDQDTGPIILRDDINWHEFRELHLRPTSATRILDDGELYRVFYIIRGTHTYNSKEMARIIDGAIQEAKALGIETLPPQELERMLNRWKPKVNI